MKLFHPKTDGCRLTHVGNGMIALVAPKQNGFERLVAYGREQVEGIVNWNWQWVHKDYRYFPKKKKRKNRK